MGFRLTDYSWVMTIHRWLGIAAVAWALLLLAVHEANLRGAGSSTRLGFRLSLFVGALLVLAAGFFGGSLIFGLDHYAC